MYDRQADQTGIAEQNNRENKIPLPSARPISKETENQRRKASEGPGSDAPVLTRLRASTSDANNEKLRLNREKNDSRSTRARWPEKFRCPGRLHDDGADCRQNDEIVPTLECSERGNSKVQHSDVAKERDWCVVIRPEQHRSQKTANYSEPCNT